MGDAFETDGALASPEIIDGRFRDVLSDPDHIAGLDRGVLTVSTLESVGASVVRVRGVLSHPLGRDDWAAANLAIRLEVPDLDGDGLASRVYTVRSYDEVDGVRMIALDVVLHDETSPMMAWLGGLAVGDRVGLVGPRRHGLPVHADGRPCALMGDETALGALASILDVWPEGQQANVWVRAGDARLVRELPTPPGVEVQRIDPATGTRFVDLLGRVGPDVTVWAAGERDECRELRDRLVELGYRPDVLRIFGYWKRGVSSTALDERRLEAARRARATDKSPDDPMAADLDIDV